VPIQVFRPVPWVGRRAIGRGLLAAIGRVLHEICELAIGLHSADVDFIDRVAHPVADVIGPVRPGLTGRLRHHDAHPTSRNQLVRKF